MFSESNQTVKCFGRKFSQHMDAFKNIFQFQDHMFYPDKYISLFLSIQQMFNYTGMIVLQVLQVITINRILFNGSIGENNQLISNILEC